MTDDELEAALRDIGRRLDHPTAADLAVRVRERVRRRPLARPWWRATFAPALATVALLLAVVAFGIPGARASAEEFLRVRGIDIFRVPGTVSTSTPPTAISGERTTLGEARRRVSFDILTPASARLGAPDEIVLDTSGGIERVTIVYRERTGFPRSHVAGIAALVVELRGSVDANVLSKVAGAGTRIEALTVRGSPGYWLEGAPHLFFYRDAAGSVREETLRLAGNTLLWEAGGVTFRLEAEISKEEALQIAASFR